MRTKTRYLARKAYRVALGMGMMVMMTALCGCSLVSQPERTPIERLDFSTSTSASGGSVQQGLSASDYDPQSTRNPAKLGLSEDQSKALGCSLRDRFDRSAALAYHFDDQQTRLALHLDVNGPSLSNVSRLEVNAVMLRYTHKFSKPPASEKGGKCRFQSNFQGLAGSIYNEFFVRDNYTVWKELRTKLKILK